jgi:WD40 repeat protein
MERRITSDVLVDGKSFYLSSFSPDNRHILLTLYTGHPFPEKPTNEILLFDLQENKVIKKIPYNRIEQLQFSKDGKYFITGTKYEGKPKVTLWDANTLEPIRDYEVPEGNDNGFRKIQISDNNKLIGINVFSPNIFVNIIETETGEIVATNKFGTAGGNFVLLQDDYFIIYEEASFEDYGLSIYKYPNIFQSKIDKGGGNVLISFENHNEIDDKLYVFQAHPTEITLYKKSTTSINEPTKPDFIINVESEKIIISYDHAENIKIIDLKGRILLDIEVSGSSASIPNTFTPGIYICVVKSGGREFSQKFQVVR